jgi:hypothetical protein
MLSFLQFQTLSERVISIGLNPEHERHRETHRQEMHDMIRKSYSYAGGYAGLGSGSKEESKAIHDDISNPHHLIKAIKRDGKLTAVNIYKHQHGRKSITSATDGTEQGKKDWKTIKQEDKGRHGWAETSLKATDALKKLGYPEIPVHNMKKILNKKLTATTGNSYKRDIGGHEHEKIGLGYPKY